MNVNECRKYFDRKKPAGAIALLLLGILFVLVGTSLDGGFLWGIIGAIMAVGGVCCMVKFGSNQSDGAIDLFCNAQADQYYKNKKDVIISQGISITDTIYSSGYCFENLFSARRAIRGKDNIWRSSIYRITCIFLTDDRVYYYDKKMSLITDEKFEKQKDFRFQDVQMVSLEETNQAIVVVITIPGNEELYVICKNKEEAFELSEKIKNKACKKE